MPNWCTNKLNVYGPAKDVLALRDSVKTEDSEFDFNGVIPMPEELQRIQCGSAIIEGKKYSRWTVRAGEDGQPKEIPVTDEDFDELIRKYGSADWYGWAVANWGTKWNSVRAELVDSDLNYLDDPDDLDEEQLDEIFMEWQFDTAWGPPTALLERLREKYPELEIRCFYMIEGGWEGSGVI